MSSARFRGDFETALGRVLDPGETILLAVSGGPDSMAMLALAHDAFAGRVAAATVDHGLRADAAAEADLVSAWCAAHAIPHRTLARTGAIDGGSAVQEQARALRYDLLARHAIEIDAHCMATAHHADDQAETFLMRASRGTGLAGLAGIRLCRAIATADGPDVTLVRPLLGWRRVELRDIALARAVSFVDDPSNGDVRFERTRVRALLHDNDWLDAAQLARAAAHASEGNDALVALSNWLWQTRKVEPVGVDDSDEQIWLDLSDLPREIRRRMVRAAIESVRSVKGITRPAFSDATNIEPLLDALENGQSATQGGILVTPKHHIWRFCAAPARRSH